MRTLHQLFLAELHDLYDAEHRILDALDRMTEAVTDSELCQAMTEHRKQTRTHIDRLERVFKLLQVAPRREMCEGIQGILTEGEELLEARALLPEVRDAGIIAAAQKVEHYEIAGYGTACAFADIMGHEQAGTILHETLEEEKEADARLTAIAEGTVNASALDADPEMSEEREPVRV